MKTAASLPKIVEASSLAPRASTVAAHMTQASLYRARSVSVNASPAATAARSWTPESPASGAIVSTVPNQLAAIERPIPTPKTRPRSWTSALAVLATPDWRCSVASSRIPIVSVIPGRSVTSAASVTTSGDASSPACASAVAQKLAATAASGATIASVRAVRVAETVIAPTTRPTIAAVAVSRQPPPRIGVRAAPAVPYAATTIGHGRASDASWTRASRASASAASSGTSIACWTSSSRCEMASRSTSAGRTRSVYVRWRGSEPTEISTSVGVADTSASRPSDDASATIRSSRSAVG